jgi:hypothetical protein
MKYVRYVIDSRDRNKTVYSTPSKYEVSLFENLCDVASVELMLADIPFSRYTFHKNNNVLHYLQGGVKKTITIEEGDYDNDIGALIHNINLMLDNIRVIYNSNNKKISFTSSAPFELMFIGKSYNHHNNVSDYKIKENSIGKMLGFNIDDYVSEVNSSGTVYKITSPFPVSFTQENYIIMRLGRAKVYTSNTSIADTSFAIINRPCHELNNNYTCNLIKKFDPPLSSFDRLKISFHDYDGNLYNFNNIEHRIELKFGLLKHGRRI